MAEWYARSSRRNWGGGPGLVDGQGPLVVFGPFAFAVQPISGVDAQPLDGFREFAAGGFAVPDDFIDISYHSLLGRGVALGNCAGRQRTRREAWRRRWMAGCHIAIVCDWVCGGMVIGLAHLSVYDSMQAAFIVAVRRNFHSRERLIPAVKPRVGWVQVAQAAG